MLICSSEVSDLPSGDSPGPQPLVFDTDSFLGEERSKDLLRFSTAGSVDDGKSTLIGRLLYDTESVYDDQVRSIEGKGSAGAGRLDLALLTDGLRAEREQGITIDVAYRYFATARRKFIIADTPGHEQYTRNMATGASTADVAIVLVDARRGVLVQSRRHAYIAALLGVPHIIVAVNKMDLVEYAEQSYISIRDDFTRFFTSIAEGGDTQLHFVPVSALAGDNVVWPSDRMAWYQGSTLLALLESIPATEQLTASPFRFAVQRVLRPHQGFRGFAGQISGGTVRRGDEILVLPSGRVSRVASIVTYDGELAEAGAPLSVCLTLEDELDISRGDMLVAPQEPATLTQRFVASLVWMDTQPLALTRRYLLKHGSRTVPGIVRSIHYSLDVADLARTEADTLAANGIGVVEIEAQQPLTLDLYTANRHTGSFVLIDPETNATVAAGMVREFVERTDDLHDSGSVTAADRVRRRGHAAAHLALTGPVEFADAVERALLVHGAVAFLCDATDVRVQQAIIAGGGIAMTLTPGAAHQAHARVGEYVTGAVPFSQQQPQASVAAVFDLLRAARVLRPLDAPIQGESR